MVIDLDQPDRREVPCMVVTITRFISAIYNLCALSILPIPNSSDLASKPDNLDAVSWFGIYSKPNNRQAGSFASTT